MIFDFLSDERLPYMILIGALLVLDLILLRRVIIKEREKALDKKRQEVYKKIGEKK